ncbi:hypothetical protein BG023_111836 [Porphyrobacter sp. LM 6]|nr:hypothetical protein BG023_111836 [Porphyrobacter sp. LM 6]
MTPGRAGLYAVPALLMFASACAPDQTSRSQPVAKGSAEDLAMIAAETCATGVSGALACLSTTFGTDACDDAEVLAATIAKDAPDAKLRIITALWADAECHMALRAAARKRGFDGDPFMAFAPFGENGFREALDFTIGPEWTGQGDDKSGIVWERIKP